METALTTGTDPSLGRGPLEVGVCLMFQDWVHCLVHGRTWHVSTPSVNAEKAEQRAQFGCGCRVWDQSFEPQGMWLPLHTNTGTYCCQDYWVHGL